MATPPPAEPDFVPTFSRLTPSEDALARAQAAVLDELLPLAPPDAGGSAPATPAARADAWAAGFAMELAPAVELHYWTNVVLACTLAARAATADPPALLPPDAAVAMARPRALPDVASWWRAAPPALRRSIFGFVVARTAGNALPAARAALPPELADVVAGCVDTVRLCRAAEEREAQVCARARAIAARNCATCGARSADMRSCARCGDAAFCDRSCQAAAWAAGHKVACTPKAAGTGEEGKKEKRAKVDARSKPALAATR